MKHQWIQINDEYIIRISSIKDKELIHDTNNRWYIVINDMVIRFENDEQEAKRVYKIIEDTLRNNGGEK